MTSQFTAIDLFAGIGGFHLGVSANGGSVSHFSEINKSAIAAYCQIHGVSPSNNLGDITAVSSIPSADFVTAGVPCQSWSGAGKNLGFDDARGKLWLDTIAFISKCKPKAFLFENVKGLHDPRHRQALTHILNLIRAEGYSVKISLVNSRGHGAAQDRERLFFVGFKEAAFLSKFSFPKAVPETSLNKVLLNNKATTIGQGISYPMLSFSDLRDGEFCIHSWDLDSSLSSNQTKLCYALLKNRRKNQYGPLDGNPLSEAHLLALVPSADKSDIERLVSKTIFRREPYLFENKGVKDLPSTICIDDPKLSKIKKSIISEYQKGNLKCSEFRFDFKNSKISSGIHGVSRVYFPSSSVFSTLVSSDTADHFCEVDLKADSPSEFKALFLETLHGSSVVRKLSKEEACLIQGFPSGIPLPTSRPAWMHLIGNSVSVSTVSAIIANIVKTGVFE